MLVQPTDVVSPTSNEPILSEGSSEDRVHSVPLSSHLNPIRLERFGELFIITFNTDEIIATL